MVNVWISLLGATVLATVSGCNPCFGSSNCPNMGSSFSVSVPSSLPSPLVSVTTTGPCKTSFSTGDSEGPVTVSATGAGTCLVYGRLANGTELTARLVFQSADLGCCGSRFDLTNSDPGFVAMDAGMT
jgi:hypothetical protein